MKKKFFNLNYNITPSTVLKFKSSEFRKCGLSRQKILYIKNIAIFFNNNKRFVKNISYYTEDEISNKLIQINHFQSLFLIGF